MKLYFGRLLWSGGLELAITFEGLNGRATTLTNKTGEIVLHQVTNDSQRALMQREETLDSPNYATLKETPIPKRFERNFGLKVHEA